MFYETEKRNHGLPHDPIKAIIGPRPIGWISAINAQGQVNLSPYSFFNAVAERPPLRRAGRRARRLGRIPLSDP